VRVDRWFAGERFETFDQFAVFEGQTLVIQRFNLSNRANLRKEVWSLTPEDTLRITATEPSAAGDPVTTEALYRRR
jgi:hypothetical protein